MTVVAGNKITSAIFHARQQEVTRGRLDGLTAIGPRQRFESPQIGIGLAPVWRGCPP